MAFSVIEALLLSIACPTQALKEGGTGTVLTDAPDLTSEMGNVNAYGFYLVESSSISIQKRTPS